MTFSSNVKMLPVAATLKTAFGASVHTTEFEWAITESQAMEALDTNPVALTKEDETIHVAVSLRLRNKEELDNLTSDLMAGRSAKILSRDEFAKRYAPTQDQVNAVVTHLTQSGFTNIKVAKNNMMVTADGTAGAARTVFKIDIRDFQATDYFVEGRNDEREAYANLNDPVMPKALEKIVLAVHGRQTVTRRHLKFVKAKAKLQLSGVSTNGRNPMEWPTIYGSPNVVHASHPATGFIADGNASQAWTDLQTITQKVDLPPHSTSFIGGRSTTEAASSLQISSKMAATSKQRGVPDVTFDVCPSSGALSFANGSAVLVDGASPATQIFTGIWARMQSAHNNNLKFPASALYQYSAPNGSTIIHDITPGKNAGYSAKAGWNYPTDFGSVNATKFAALVRRNSGF